MSQKTPSEHNVNLDKYRSRSRSFHTPKDAIASLHKILAGTINQVKFSARQTPMGTMREDEEGPPETASLQECI